MRKTAILLAVALMTGVVSLAFAADTDELRPAQKVMRARAAWMKSMNEALAAGKVADVAKDAGELSAQAAKVGAGAEGERKDLHLKVSELAKAAADAAGKGDAEAVKAKLSEIKATCADCHAKFRDKK